MEKKFEAINLRITDIKESDKLVTFLTSEGKFSANLKGVRSAKSKLKFVGELFSYNELNTTQKNHFLTITNASNIDLFFEIREDFDKFYCASVVVAFCDKFIFDGQDSQEIFELLKRTLHLFKTQNPFAVLTFFLLKALEIEGYKLELYDCLICGEKINQTSSYNAANLSISCENCDGLGISPEVLSNLRACECGDLEKFDNNFKSKTFKLLAYHMENAVEKFDILEKLI